MFSLHCAHCGETWLVDTSSIVALANTASGPVVTARCPRGHVVAHRSR